ncbi:MAG: hypothetical protein AB9872_00305 [Solidesulfovibrio sp.]
MRLPTQRRREGPDVLALRRAMREHGVVLRRERGFDDWSMLLVPACAGNLLTRGSMAEITAAWSAWQEEQNRERMAR